MTTRPWLASVVLELGLWLTLSGCAPTPPPNDDPAAVVQRFLAARQTRNLEATMDCFVQQPEMRSSLGVGWVGRDAVRAIMAYRLADNYTVGDLRVVGNRAAWSQQVRRNVAGSPVASFDEEVEATVVGDRIARLVTYEAGSHPSLAVEPTPKSSSEPDLLVALSILVLVAAAVLVWPTPMQVEAPHAQSGHLLSGLRDYVARRG